MSRNLKAARMQGISDLSWDALGEKLCTASDDFTLKLWDAAKGECLRTLEGHTSYVFCCCFAPIGNALVRNHVSTSLFYILLLRASKECSAERRCTAALHGSNVPKLHQLRIFVYVPHMAHMQLPFQYRR